MNTNNQSQPTTNSSSSQSFERPGFFLTPDLQWVKVVYRGNQIGLFHCNFFLKLLDIPYTPSSQKASQG